jgi:hypothetical protein
MTAEGALEIRLLGRFVVVRDGSEIAAAAFGHLTRALSFRLRALAAARVLAFTSGRTSGGCD